jgi:FlgN protein
MNAARMHQVGAERRLVGDVLEHLRAQLDSARRMLTVVTAQGDAIHSGDAGEVARRAAELQVELDRRALLEDRRTRILEQAALMLGIPARHITLASLEGLMSDEEFRYATALSAELQERLRELRRGHDLNRALMRQELAFLDHLLRVMHAEPGPGYDPTGARAGSLARRPATTHSSLSLQA